VDKGDIGVLLCGGRDTGDIENGVLVVDVIAIGDNEGC